MSVIHYLGMLGDLGRAVLLSIPDNITRAIGISFADDFQRQYLSYYHIRAASLLPWLSTAFYRRREP